jgi:cytochrome c556
MMTAGRLALALALICAIGGPALGDPKTDRAAVAQLEAMYEPIGKLGGADRVNRACADAVKLRDASQAFSDERAPAGAAVDNHGWSSAARSLQGALSALVAVCKAPDRKRKLLDEVQTADQVVVSVDQDMRALFELVKPRKLPASLKTFKATLGATKFPSKTFCSRITALSKQLRSLAAPADDVDAAKWQQAFATVKSSVEGLRCTSPAADEQTASAFAELHDQVNALVLLVPADTRAH